MSLRVLLALHNRLNPGAGGASGATLALGTALSDLGCRVEYFGYEHAYGHDTVDMMGSELHFPWRLNAFLKHRAKDFDVLEISSGDAWAWARKRTSISPVVITRSHGLEHTFDQWLRADAAAGKLNLSWKYPIYHGGYRLWEVRQSLKRSDHALMLNDQDRDYAVNVLRVAPNKISVLGNGIARHFLNLPDPTLKNTSHNSQIKLAFLGEWTERKGKRTIVQTAKLLNQSHVSFQLTLFGTRFDEVEVRADFPPELRPLIRVVPRYRNAELPELLSSFHAQLMVSFAEGYALVLPEAMACGLAPVATKVGGASRVVSSGINGELIEPGDSVSAAAIIKRWADNRPELDSVRRRAQQTVQRHDWNEIAAQTLGIYERVLSRVVGVVPKTITAGVLSPARAIWQRSGKPALSICICTANRPAVLRRCLASIEQGDVLPAEVIVGDDTLDGTATAAVCSDFPFVRYVRGPRQGLCANRNVVIAAAMGEYLSLLDDDSEVTTSFVRLSQEIIARTDGRTIFTGDVLKDGVERVTPLNPTFWGHFGKPLSPLAPCETIQLNCNLFPRSAFADARFDERIVYGYEDMDLCQQLLAAGHRIEYRPELVNLHLPLPKASHVLRTQDQQAQRARYYTSLKRYMLWQSRPIRALVYAALAPFHQAAHHVLARQLGKSLAGFSDMSWAVHQALAFRRAAQQPRKVFKNRNNPRYKTLAKLLNSVNAGSAWEFDRFTRRREPE